MTIEQWMGWGLTSLAVIGFTAIGLVAVWPRWRRWRVLRQACREGFQHLPLKSAEAQRLLAPAAAGLLGLGPGCSLRAAWKTPLPEAYVATIRCHYSTPRPGGTTRKYRTYIRFVVLEPLSIDTAFTVQKLPPNNPLARLVTGMIEQRTGAALRSDETLLPAFRAQFAVRGSVPLSSSGIELSDTFQLACLDRHQGGNAPLDLGRLLGEEGGLVVSPQGLLLEPNQNYAPRSVAELQAIVALLTELLRSI